jgi:small conductance mechanosensitive channel
MMKSFAMPNLVLALIVFAIFFFVARTLKQFVRQLTRALRQARNLGLVLVRLTQGATILAVISLFMLIDGK